MIFNASTLDTEFEFQFPYPHEEVYISSGDVKIHGIWIKRNKERNKVVLYFHGNTNGLERWSKYTDEFYDRGVDVFMIDYQGYGKSGGMSTHKTFYSDALAAYDWLAQHYAGEAIYSYGRSLGSAAATRVSAERNTKHLILETPFTNMAELIAAYPWSTIFPIKFPVEISVSKYLPQVECPVTMLQGDLDRIVPLKVAQCLVDLMQEKDEFIIIRGGNHGNLSDFEEYGMALDTLLGKK